jgi:hypothetical protein
MSQSYIDGSVRTFIEESAGAMTNKNYLFAKQAAAVNEISLAVAGDAAIGVIQSKLHNDATDVPVRLLNAGGTVKVTLGGTVALGASLASDAAAKAVTAASTDYVLGQALQAGVTGDIIEMIPQSPTILA